METAAAQTVDPEWSFEKLIDHILTQHHHPLKDELVRLEGMAMKVFRVHGDKDPRRFEMLWQLVMQLRDETETHLLKEEQVLFPAILAGEARDLVEPIESMGADHEVHVDILRKIRECTGDFVVPQGACNTWRGLWNGLEALERDLFEHFRLEEKVLFPRVLASA